MELRKRNPALSPDATFKKMKVGDEKAIYAFVREKSGKKILVILNLSPKEQPIIITDKALTGKTYNVFTGLNESVTNKPWMIEPWGYTVYEYGR